MSEKGDLDDHFDEDEDNLHPHQPSKLPLMQPMTTSMKKSLRKNCSR